MYKFIKTSTSVKASTIPAFSTDAWEMYMDEGEDGKYYTYYDEENDIEYELVEMPDGWNGNVDGEPLIVNPSDPLYKSAEDAIKALVELASKLY